MKRLLTRQNMIITAALLMVYIMVQVLLSTGIISAFYETNLILGGIGIIMAVSLNLITGFAGQFTLGHAGFMAIGAYFSAVMTVKWGMPFIVSLLGGACLAAVMGFLIGLPTLRLKGDYLAIATLGMGEVIRVVLLNTKYVGGAAGLFGIPRVTNWTWIFVCSVVTVLCIRNLLWSSYGRACISVREDEVAAEIMGVDITHYKVLAFVVGAFFAGLGGALYSHYYYFIQPGGFGFMKSIEYLVMVVLGGMGSITGSIMAAIVLTVINVFLQQYSAIRMILYALLLIIIMIFRPEGLMGSKEFSTAMFRRFERRDDRGSAGGK